MQSRSPRRHRIVLAGIVTAFAVLAGSTAVVQRRADASWSQMQMQAQAMQTTWQERNHHREPLWGDVHDESASAHYDQALALTKTFDQGRLVRALHTQPELLACEHAELRTQWQPVLAALRAGAHALDAAPMHRHAGPIDSGMLANLLSCRWVGNIAVIESRALLHADRDVEAVQCTLDAAMFGADLQRRGVLINQMIACGVLAIATSEAWPESGLAQLGEPALIVLATGLERLDRALPEVLELDGELLFMANALQHSQVDALFLPAPSLWRYAFSSRWMAADAFLLAAAIVHEFGQANDFAWPQRAALIELHTRELADSGNPAAALLVPNLRSAEQNLRETITLLRLLRMSVQRRLGHDVPPLRDPLGDGPLRVTKSDNGVRLHSIDAQRRPTLAREVDR